MAQKRRARDAGECRHGRYVVVHQNRDDRNSPKSVKAYVKQAVWGSGPPNAGIEYQMCLDAPDAKVSSWRRLLLNLTTSNFLKGYHENGFD